MIDPDLKGFTVLGGFRVYIFMWTHVAKKEISDQDSNNLERRKAKKEKKYSFKYNLQFQKSRVNSVEAKYASFEYSNWVSKKSSKLNSLPSPSYPSLG